jgi:hypothetical protein
MSDRRVRAGFWAAAIFNIAGMLIFSKAFTNELLFTTDPQMFSRPGCVLVMVWGLAYLAQSRTWREAPAISAVFALEKFIYAGWWIVWISQYAATLASLFERDLLTGAFYSLYGAGDAAFGVFFAIAAFKARRAPRLDS